jgi:hypothetical protein
MAVDILKIIAQARNKGINFEEYCDSFPGTGYCKIRESNVPKSFCDSFCGVRYELRKRYCSQPELPVESGLVSVIITSRNEELLNRTIKNVQANAKGSIEFIIGLDGESEVEYLPVDGVEFDNNGVIKQPNVIVLKYNEGVGRRVLINRASRLANGEFMLHIDAHCTMSTGWDTQLKADCGERDVLVCRLFSIAKDMSRKSNRVYEFGSISPEFKTNWWTQYRRRIGNTRLAETMSFQGCGWFLRSDYWRKLGGFMEGLTHWGYNGSELACLIWLHEKYPGKILLHRDVYCGHYFRKKFPYKFSWRRQVNVLTLKRRYGHKLKWLANKFKPVPGWEVLKAAVQATDKEASPALLTYCREWLNNVRDCDLYVVEKPADKERSLLTMYEQLLEAVEKAPEAKNIYIAEHDVLYPKAHFSFTPLRKDTYYYPKKAWRLNKRGFFEWKKPLFSGLVADRQLILKTLKARIKALKCGAKFKWVEFGLEEIDPSQKVVRFNDYPHCIDIRHSSNFTYFAKSRLMRKHYKTVPGWGEDAETLWGWLQPQLPNTAQLGKNFGKAVIKHIAGGFKKRTPAEQEEILAICKANKCGKFILRNNAYRCAHSKCGCYLKKKVKWASEHCPEGHW